MCRCVWHWVRLVTPFPAMPQSLPHTSWALAIAADHSSRRVSGLSDESRCSPGPWARGSASSRSGLVGLASFKKNTVIYAGSLSATRHSEQSFSAISAALFKSQWQPRTSARSPKIPAKVNKVKYLVCVRIGSLYWGLSSLRRYFPLFTLALAVAALYLYELDGVGVFGPDEPRYAAIGRAMAHTGDLVTPRLWGTPWFEKPPLLYWMVAAGTACGLNPDLSARLPVALLSLAFLAIAFWLLKREFGAEPAGIAIACLATCAGWVAFSDLALTDLPLAVFFSVAVFLALPLLRVQPEAGRTGWRLLAIGMCLGLAILAKGLVPIVLAVPFLWFLRRYWKHWWVAIFTALAVALPWYVATYAHNGSAFLEDFFWKQHFERLYSPALQHVQPWYYYVPVFLAGLFPWIPLLLLLWFRRSPWDERHRFLTIVFAFGFLFFSISLNKLPGYLLPLFPSVFALIGAQFETQPLAQLSRWWMLPCAVLIACIPLLGSLLPQWLVAGRISSVTLHPVSATEIFYIAVPLATVLVARRSWLGPALILCIVAGGVYLKTVAYPVLNQSVSARNLWREIKDVSGSVCDGGTNRNWAYGLSFYRGATLPPCTSGKFQYKLQSHDHGPPSLTRMGLSQ